MARGKDQSSCLSDSIRTHKTVSLGPVPDMIDTLERRSDAETELAMDYNCWIRKDKR